jgi:predicted O-methyltransferase YrrM
MIGFISNEESVMDFSIGFNGDGLQPKENEALYQLIRDARPESVFEVGTRRGGGSTFFITSALRDNGGGMLYTVECDPECYQKASDFYNHSHPELRPFVTLMVGKSQDVLPTILAKVGKIDVLFLDGEEHSNRTVEEYKMFLPYLLPGSKLACHDWNIGKMAILKPDLLSDKNWQVRLVFDDTMTGFAILNRVG